MTSNININTNTNTTKTIDKNLLDLYSDYLLTSFSYTTSVGLSKSLDGQISNSKISRFLAGNYQEKGELKHTERIKTYRIYL